LATTRNGEPRFAHPSERTFAELLDFYEVDWEYEQRSFPLAWDEHGTPTEAFTPDFYLPEFDLYVELTTLRQSLVTRKNRKLRRLRELYPNVRIKLLYRNDVHKLLTKYGLSLFATSDDLGSPTG
jgi:hypoxanthine phosphoribosyltransferase